MNPTDTIIALEKALEAGPTLPHEWDDDACCIHCGFDGAEAWHLTKFCGYEMTDSDRFCAARAALASTEPTKEAATDARDIVRAEPWLKSAEVQERLKGN